MLATLQQLKDALGIAGAEQDALLTSCLTQANALIAGYIGADLSDSDTDRPVEMFVPEGATFAHLPVWPVLSITSLTANGVALVENTDYTVSKREGAIFFDNLPGNAATRGNKLEGAFKAGYAEPPSDLNMVCLNIASTAYNNGGQLLQQAGSNELKSLTMFDAMSMSFDTTSSQTNTPEALVRTWNFILDKYRLNVPVMK